MVSQAHAEVLRDTIRRIEQNADLSPDHPDMRELKRILLEKIAVAEIGDTEPHPNSAAETN